MTVLQPMFVAVGVFVDLTWQQMAENLCSRSVLDGTSLAKYDRPWSELCGYEQRNVALHLGHHFGVEVRDHREYGVFKTFVCSLVGQINESIAVGRLDVSWDDVNSKVMLVKRAAGGGDVRLYMSRGF